VSAQKTSDPTEGVPPPPDVARAESVTPAPAAAVSPPVTTPRLTTGLAARLERVRAAWEGLARRQTFRVGRSLSPWVVGALAVAVLVSIGTDFQMYVAGTVLIYAMAALGLSWLMGHAGQVSIGTAALMAVGGYLTAVLSSDYSWGVFPVPILLSGVIGGILGLIVGLPALRLSGIYLALATLALQFIVVFGADRYQQHTGNISGFAVAPPTIGDFQFTYGQSYVILLSAFLALTILIIRNLYHHAPGRMWLAIRESELAASAIGVNTTRWKLSAFIGSSAIIACAGSLFAYYTQRVSSETYSLDFAITFIVMIIIGGMGSIAGAVVGAILVTIAPYLLTFATSQLPESAITGWLNNNIFYLNNGLYGLLVLFFLLYRPDGAVPALRQLGRTAIARLVARPKLTAPAERPTEMSAMPQRTEGVSAPPLLVVEGLRVTYQTGARAVDGIDLEVPEGAIVALIGRNGAGKTSTLRAVSGFFGSENVRLEGRVTIAGRNVLGMSPNRTSQLGIVLVPEREKVFPSLTVAEHLRIAQTKDGPRFEDESLFAALRPRLKSPAGLLSGGERQLLALSTAWLLRPRLMMIDELSLGLAPVMIRRLVAGVRELREKHGMTFLLVEQNAAAALDIADWVYLVEAGRIMAQGKPEDVAQHKLLIPIASVS
jgi:branched-chain amino acid transport system permease protein